MEQRQCGRMSNRRSGQESLRIAIFQSPISNSLMVTPLGHVRRLDAIRGYRQIVTIVIERRLSRFDTIVVKRVAFLRGNG